MLGWVERAERRRVSSLLAGVGTRAIGILTRVDKGALSITDQMVSSGSNFATTLILARLLGKHEFGLFVLANTVLLLVASAQNALIWQPLMLRGAMLDKHAVGSFLRANVVIQSVLLVTGSAVIAIVGLLWKPLRPVMVPLAVASALYGAQEFFRRVLYTRGRVGSAVVNDVVSYGLQAVGVWVLAWRVGVSVGTALWVVGLTSLLGVILGAWQLREYWARGMDDLRSVVRANFEIGKWITAVVMLDTVSIYAYPALVAALVDLQETAALGVITQVLAPLVLLIRPLDSYYTPAAARALVRGGAEGSRRVVLDSVRLIAPPYGLYLLGTIVFASPILSIVFGERYVQYAEVLRVFAIAATVHFPIGFLHIMLNVRRMQHFFLVEGLCSVVLTYTVGLYLVGRLGLIGLAVTAVMTRAGQLCVLGLGMKSTGLSAHGRARVEQ